MKRVISILLIVVFVAVVGGTFWFLWSKSRKKPIVFKTERAAVMDIVKKTVATGAIVPRREVEIKPRVSGVLADLQVEPGDVVTTGQPIAKIQIVPDAVTLNRAESDVRSSRIALDNAKRELDRNENLFRQGVVSEAEVARFRTDYQLRRQELAAATDNLKLVKEGAKGGKDQASNVVVVSTVDGMVIDVPVKEGFSVIESNNFNPGTTIAVVADMGDMIFQGQVDESEVGKIRNGLRLQIKIGALEQETFEGELEYIAPKGKEIDGAIQFEIKAKIVKQNPDVFIRAGYSANADIVLDERTQVLAMREALLQFGDGDPYVEIATAPQEFERRAVELGLSDGIHVEVKAGVGPDDVIKIPSNAGPAGMPGGGRGGALGGRGPPRRAR
jgi:HlyD family secretion protein